MPSAYHRVAPLTRSAFPKSISNNSERWFSA